MTLDILWILGRYAFVGLLYLFVLLVLRALLAELRAEAQAIAPATPAPRPVALPHAEPAAAARPTPSPGTETAAVAERLSESLPPRLVVVQSPDPAALPVGTAFPLTAVSTVGRGDHNSVALRSDQFASSNHALVFMRGGKVHLRDRGSTNGTYVNGVRLEDEVPLNDGDRISVGTTEFRFTA